MMVRVELVAIRAVMVGLFSSTKNQMKLKTY